MPKTVLLILAGGCSSRLKRPKQLVDLGNGESLLQHTIRMGLESRVNEIVLVLGADFDTHSTHVAAFNDSIHVLKNEEWSQGIGNSIKEGVRFVKSKLQTFDQLLISVCDQPFLQPDILNDLLTKAIVSEKSVIASRYNGQLYGVPVLFKKAWFDKLRQVPDNCGALFLIKQHPEELDTISFAKGVIDIDTDEDLECLSQSRPYVGL